jgi:hypothetical protein
MNFFGMSETMMMSVLGIMLDFINA